MLHSGVMASPPPRVTIAVIARERFEKSVETLEQILAVTAPPYDLVCVDGNAPSDVRAGLEALATRHGFELLLVDEYIAPNQARNLAAGGSTTDYVCFVDNDLWVTEGWLDRLVEAADETGAWAVGPLYLEGDPEGDIAHMLGGEMSLTGPPGARVFHEHHHHQALPISELPEPLRRGETGLLEMHCLLVRREALDLLMPLDEGLLSMGEHVDICLQILDAGGKLIMEPESRVTYLSPPPIRRSDFAFYQLRWSEAWNSASADRMAEKYGLVAPEKTWWMRVFRSHRLLYAARIKQTCIRLFGRRLGRLAWAPFVAVDLVLNRLLVRRLPGPARPRRFHVDRSDARDAAGRLVEARPMDVEAAGGVPR